MGTRTEWSNELASPQFKRDTTWRADWKGLYKRNNYLTLKSLNYTIKTVSMKMTAILNSLQ